MHSFFLGNIDVVIAGDFRASYNNNDAQFERRIIQLLPREKKFCLTHVVTLLATIEERVRRHPRKLVRIRHVSMEIVYIRHGRMHGDRLHFVFSAAFRIDTNNPV